MIETIAGPGRNAVESFGQPGDPALILIMGATASMRFWPDDLCHRLAAGGRLVIRFDNRDTGQARTWPAGEPGYAVEDMADDVLAVMDHFGLAAAHLCGMSLGGLMAQMVAVRQPGRVLSLTLVASESLGWDGDPMPEMSPDFMEAMGALATLDWQDLAAVEAFTLRQWELCAGPAVPFDRVAWAALVHDEVARSVDPAAAYNHGQLTLRDDWAGAFRRIAQPVLVIHGSDDPILPLPNGEALAEGTGGRLLVLEGRGHELPAMDIGRVAEAILRHTA